MRRLRWRCCRRNCAATRPSTRSPRSSKVVPIWRSPFGAQTYMLPAVIVLSAMGALLLLIVCANITGLVLARGISRRGEIAAPLRSAPAAGGSCGCCWSKTSCSRCLPRWWRLRSCRWPSPRCCPAFPTLLRFACTSTSSVDRLVIAFSVLAACGSALVFGLLPALRSSGVDLLSVMKDDLSPRGGGTGTLSHGAGRLAGGGVAVVADRGRVGHAKSRRSATGRPGIRRHQRGLVENRCLVERVRPDPRARLFRAAARPLARRPGTASATLATKPAADDGRSRGATSDHRRVHPRRDEDLTFLSNIVAPDYFRTLNIRLIAGREFESRDDAAAMPVAIVNETLARRYWAAERRPSASACASRRTSGARLSASRGTLSIRASLKRHGRTSTCRFSRRINRHDAPRARFRRRCAVDRTPRTHVQALDPDVPMFETTMLSDQRSGDADDPGNGR